MNAEPILQKLSEIRNAIPQVPQPRRETIVIEDFEYAAVADALEAMGDDLAAAITGAQTALAGKCLEIYYAAEELSRDPAHVDLVPHVEEMRRAYERSYGRAIPPRKT